MTDQTPEPCPPPDVLRDLADADLLNYFNPLCSAANRRLTDDHGIDPSGDKRGMVLRRAIRAFASLPEADRQAAWAAAGEGE